MKTYRKELQILRENIIADIKAYIRHSTGSKTGLIEIPPFTISIQGYEDIQMVGVYNVSFYSHKQKLAFDNLSTENLVRIHSYLVTGSPNL